MGAGLAFGPGMSAGREFMGGHMAKKNKPKLEKAKRNREYARAHKKRRRAPSRGRVGRPQAQPQQPQQQPPATIEAAFSKSA